jgi:NAD(P)H dehydrogenase (quinone)
MRATPRLRALTSERSSGQHLGDRVLVVFAHPTRNSFVGALTTQIETSLLDKGRSVKTIDLYADDFAPAMTAEQLENYFDTNARLPRVQTYVDNLLWANALVFVYPTWFGAQPAILKGFFDQVLLPDVAFRLPKRFGPLRPRLTHIRSVDVVTTHGSKKIMNSVQGEPGKRVLMRGLRSLCHWRCRTRWIAFYGNDSATAEDRSAFVDRVVKAFSAKSTRRNRVRRGLGPEGR